MAQIDKNDTEVKILKEDNILKSEFRIPKNRLEAFSDGVLAIIITIMVLELKVPHGSDLSALLPLWPKFLSYVLSFVFIGIYWNNHHHMIAASKGVNGASMWANLHLLFWLSLVPFATGFMGENHFAPLPTAVYGFVLFMSGVAYNILAKVLINFGGPDCPIAIAYQEDNKGVWSLILYGVSIPIASIAPMVSFLIYILVALMWFIPEKNIERLAK
jgi:uncharacterized membrane protein